jgi:mycothiol synthase
MRGRPFAVHGPAVAGRSEGRPLRSSAMDGPLGYVLRSATPEDFSAAADVLVADELDDSGEVVLGPEFLRAQWDRGGFDPTTDAWVAAAPEGAVVAYGHGALEEPTVVESWGIVHPEHRGRGVGTALLDRIERRAVEMLGGIAGARFRHAINAADRGAAGMVMARGLHPFRHFWHMRIDVDEGFEAGGQPDGIRFRGIDPSEDLPAIHVVLVDAFAEDPGHTVAPFDRWVREEASGSSFDPSLWLIAEDRSTIVGVLTASDFGDRGWIDYLAVLSETRGRGIGAALLRRSFATFAGRGIRTVFLNVDAENVTGATALYERVGMRVVKRWDLWERTIA